MKRKGTHKRKPRPSRSGMPEPLVEPEDRGEIVPSVREVLRHGETGPALTGGDVDADWMRAHLSGEEAVGGSVATPDQDVVDEIARALGVEQPLTEDIRSSEEILRDRDRLRRHGEREAGETEGREAGEGAPAPPPGEISVPPAQRALSSARVEEFRHRLRRMRERLFRAVATIDDELATLEAHQPGAPAEDVARESATALLSRLGDREQDELEEISAAQERLEAGRFGICEKCGRPIPLARLRVLPTARRCIRCRSREEGERG